MINIDGNEQVKILTLRDIWKRSMPTLMHDFEEFKTPQSEGRKRRCDGNGWRTTVRSRPGDVAKLFQSHIRFLKMESIIIVEDAMNIVKMTTKNLDYFKNLVEKTVALFKKID